MQNRWFAQQKSIGRDVQAIDPRDVVAVKSVAGGPPQTTHDTTQDAGTVAGVTAPKTLDWAERTASAGPDPARGDCGYRVGPSIVGRERFVAAAMATVTSIAKFVRLPN